MLGSDGALWFTESRGNAIGRLGVDGKVTEYPIPTPDAFAADITRRPGRRAVVHGVRRQQDRAHHDRRRDHRVHAAGRRRLPGPIVAGADGALWFAERNTNKIGRMTTAGVLTNEFALPTENANPLALVAAPDGDLYFTQHSDGTVARMTYGGVVTKQFRLPTGSPDGLGLDGRRRPLVHAGQLRPGRPHRPALGPADQRVRHDVRHAPLRRAPSGRSRRSPTPTRSARYSVTIKWGDGSTSAGWVRRAGGGFEVRGRHAYEKAKTFGVTVKIDKVKVDSTAVVSSSSRWGEELRSPPGSRRPAAPSSRR